MTPTSNDELLFVYEKLEDQLMQVINESDNVPHLATSGIRVQPKKPMNCYESKMRSYAALCEAGR
ncbi:hypothetical protein [Solimicrobium silvestre]|uniref:Uncharacterized protein n=1 Tax=Solimicrobium silvestre TaxID=2099400 RepID=A0A2S9GUL4_9BURK|nr:hypothetical protein [Solimicrobium silvestre]PRC91425.1 hypothetical protein S2091_3840 [Solimicrobium silvestre]